MRAVVEDVPEYAAAVEIRRDVPAKGGKGSLYGGPEGVGEDDEERRGHDEAVFVHCVLKGKG